MRGQPTPLALEEQLLDTFRISDRVTRYVLDAIPPEGLAAKAGGKGRTVGAMFAHLHNVRLMWLEVSAPDLMAGLAKIGRDDAIDHGLLRASFEASAPAVAALLRRGIETGRIKNYKPHPAAFLGYLIAHDGYHRGEAGIALAQSGVALDQKTSYGMWEWGVR